MARATRMIVDSSKHRAYLILVVLIASVCYIWCSSAQAVIEAPTCSFSTQQSVVINFFIHDDLDIKPVGSAFTVVNDVNPVNGANNRNLFGSIAVFDDAITEGPNVTSKLLARGRGFYVFDYLQAGSTSLEFVFTAIFSNESSYEGSTLTFKGYDNIQDEYREIAITGGTGFFRLARGWAGITTYSLVGGAAVLNTTCYVYYGCNYGVNQTIVGSGSASSQTVPFAFVIASLALCTVLFRFHHTIF